MNVGQYIRLMALACIEMSSTVPISIVSLYISNEAVPIQPWISWDNVHYNFSHVGLYPTVIWRSDPSYVAAVEMSLWLFPACALLFFTLFGFAAEARKHYCAAFLSIIKFFGYKPASRDARRAPPRWKCSLNKSMDGLSSGSLPVYVTSFPPRVKREASFEFSSKSYATGSDLEKATNYSLSTLPRYSAGNDVSPTATDFSDFDTSTRRSGMEAKCSSSHPDSVDISDVSASHHPFTPPSVLPVGVNDARMSHCLDAGITVSVQTQYGIAL
ncbi:hypothetical protein M404DRAFT_824953 [Pisolithus tinctorius Marx 270]|uniref:Uncharacterized protein n=1 Tax=Pisolithus tinctorius Marx 270 TaxID=870435 RepID=A0A0C3NTV4_PISTI|nr:hypothetical protein M404DRAFT_824953 [Pisolithus tinctorius Marx 270]